MSSSSTNADTTVEPNRKFTMRDAMTYSWLRDQPEKLRHFASSFLPVPGFPPPLPNADDGVFVTYHPKVVNASTGLTVALEPKEILLPKGAAALAAYNLELRNLIGCVMFYK